MIGVVVPAHQEEALLGACLASVAVAAARVDVGVLVVVALDACTDASAEIARAAGAETVAVQARCVGVARAAGAARVLAAGARWVASTDADSIVAPDWLEVQLGHASGAGARADAVCGLVRVADWVAASRARAPRFRRGLPPGRGAPARARRESRGVRCRLPRGRWVASAAGRRGRGARRGAGRGRPAGGMERAGAGGDEPPSRPQGHGRFRRLPAWPRPAGLNALRLREWGRLRYVRH